MNIGLNLFSIRNKIQTEEDIRKVFIDLKNHSLDFVQFSGSPLPLSVVSKISKETSMPVILTHSPYDRIINDLDNLMAEHRELGAKFIGLGMLPAVTSNQSTDEEIKSKIEILDRQAKTMKEHGFIFCYHNHYQEFRRLKSGETIFDYMIKNAPNIHFTLDTYWVQYGGASIIETIQKLVGRIECVHLKDYKISSDLKPEFAPIGQGNINFNNVVHKMKKAGTQYFFIEQDNAADLPDGYDQVLSSIAYCKTKL